MAVLIDVREKKKVGLLSCSRAVVNSEFISCKHFLATRKELRYLVY